MHPSLTPDHLARLVDFLAVSGESELAHRLKRYGQARARGATSEEIAAIWVERTLPT